MKRDNSIPSSSASSSVLDSLPPADAAVVLLMEIDRAVARAGSEPGGDTRACALFCEQMGYLLRMSWLGRADKMQRGIVPALDWITRSGLSLSEVDYPGFAPGVVHFNGADLEALANKATQAVFRKMRATEPEPDSGTFFGRLGKRLGL